MAAAVSAASSSNSVVFTPAYTPTVTCERHKNKAQQRQRKAKGGHSLWPVVVCARRDSPSGPLPQGRRTPHSGHRKASSTDLLSCRSGLARGVRRA
eukprot:scaffold6273_cov376-Prasinococcus_capsulatus_cf.AAC.8